MGRLDIATFTISYAKQKSYSKESSIDLPLIFAQKYIHFVSQLVAIQVYNMNRLTQQYTIADKG